MGREIEKNVTDKIAQMHDEGCRIAEISRATGVCNKTVRKYVRKHETDIESLPYDLPHPEAVESEALRDMEEWESNFRQKAVFVGSLIVVALLILVNQFCK